MDVNVHPTKQLVRFSEEKEVRLAISEAVRNAIQGTVRPLRIRMDAPQTPKPQTPPYLRRVSGIDAPVAAPSPHPTEDHPAGGATSPISPARRSATNNEGGSGVPDSLFGASKSSRSDSSRRRPTSSEQRRRIEEASAPLSRVGSAPGVERGELPRLRDLRVVGQIGSGYILVDDP